MNKYTFLVFHNDYQAFLEQIRELGMVHISAPEGAGEDTERLQSKLLLKAQIQKLIETVEGLIPQGQKADPYSSNTNENNLVDEYNAMTSKMQQLTQELAAVNKEADRMLPWGIYSYREIENLKSKGLSIQFWSSPASKVNPEWVNEFNMIEINNVSSQVYFVTINKTPITIEAEPVQLNEADTTQLLTQAESIEKEIEIQKSALSTWAKNNLNNLKHYALTIEEQIDWDTVEINTLEVANGNAMLLEGYAPVDNEKEIQNLLDLQGVYYEMAPADKEDEKAPIKLKNNAFSRMYEVLTKMYGMPDYGEFDPTPILAPFFSIFFGMCMGDAGYGLALIILGFVLRSRLSQSMRGMMNLVITLGVFTTLAGLVLGTFFGFDMKTMSFIPQACRDLIIQGSSTIAGISLENAMLVAIGIGVFHLCVAMVVKAVGQTQRFGFKESLGTWGWTLLVVGGVLVGCLIKLSILPSAIGQWVLIAIAGVSALGIYFLNNIHRNPLINFGAGLYDTYNMATGLLGDILSYIRLYALGLAGGMLGAAFNMLANMAFSGARGIPVVGIVLGAIFYGIIFCAGHVLNIALSCLSAFVHPLRLSFVEYFKNAGYNGTGVEYKPFATKEELK